MQHVGRHATEAQRSLALAAVVVMLTLEGCDEHAPAPRTTTLTTTFACPAGQIPWPSSTGVHGIVCQALSESMTEAENFLKEFMPPWDAVNVDSLEEGIITPTIDLSFAARDIYPWAEDVPKDIWENYVLPYANVNEPRVDWRPLLANKSASLVQNPGFQAENRSQVLSILNSRIWSLLRPEGEIKFKSDQTPLIYDPMSIIEYGYASCTGLSIMLVDTLRSVGVPARLAGTAAWHGNVSDGDHTWVEVWLGGGRGLNGDNWSFIESQPAGPGETLENPCDKWFCNPGHFDNKTKAFAVQFDRRTNTTVYPMSWDLPNRNIPGVERTTYYNALCQPCGKSSSVEIAV